MPSMSNIEKSAFRRGEYVGYGGGLVFHIRRDGQDWIATATGAGIRIIRPTLAMLSVALENVIADTSRPCRVPPSCATVAL